MSTFSGRETFTANRLARVEAADYISPKYEVDITPAGLKLRVFIPDVPASGVEITSKGPDLIVTARRPHLVRVNFRGAHLESALHNYRLVLRVGYGFDSTKLSARLEEGMLRLSLPAVIHREPAHRKVA
ncbi:MAG: Hsp20/alpha crystallin family protein [Opitutaceae bacterium]|nr:Hsp20/alpha crystallin family protein [Opitutaceae bacterium]